MKKWVVLGLAVLFGVVLAVAPSPAAAELKVGVSGYVKLDVYYADKITGGAPAPSPANTPLDPTPGMPAGAGELLEASRVADNGETVLSAQESRVRVTFSDEFMKIKVSGRVEGDFFGAGGNSLTSNSRGFRLRRAFARADHPSGFFLSAGQDWSLFMNDEIAANTSSPGDAVDFNGPAGQIFARQPQLRVGYKMPLGRGNGDLVVEADVEQHSAASLEDPAAGDFGTANLGAAATTQGFGQEFPLFAGKVSWLHPRFQAEAAFAVADNTAIVAATGQDVSETAFGFQVSAQVNFDPFTIFGHYQHIDGLGRLANGDFPDAFLIAATNTVENVESNGFYFGATYKLTKDTLINAFYGWAEADAVPVAGFGGAGDGGFALETHRSLHVDLIHNFWERWRAGIEYRRFEVEAFNGTEGDVNIIQGAIWYFF